MSAPPEVDHSRESAILFFLDYVKKNGNELRAKQVCDLSAGRGYVANLFEEVGAAITAYDLFRITFNFWGVGVSGEQFFKSKEEEGYICHAS
jgi:adenine-specific DNA methylase